MEQHLLFSDDAGDDGGCLEQDEDQDWEHDQD